MLARLSELFGAQRAPTGYWPGATLERVRRNLGQPSFECSAPVCAQFQFSPEGPLIEVHERAEAQLLMHVVLTEFRFHTPASRWSEGCYQVHHTGAITRTGLVCRRRKGPQAFADWLTCELSANPVLREALMPLDFKKITLEYTHGGWDVVLEHMGGSEVVNRMPAFRRYISLSVEQTRLLQQSILALHQVLKTL